MAAGKKYQEPVYIEEEMNEKYMEGNYDGDADQQYKQEQADKRRSVQIEEEIRASQGAVYEKETERLSYEEKAVGEAFTKLMREYIEDNIYQQYLVDGAVLRCNQAMTDDVVFTEWGEKVVLENKADEVCNIILNVPENPVYEDDDSENSMMINGLRYATVKDTIKNVNIIVPKCNCRLAADRDEEEKRIRNDTDRNKNGVCMHLMRLNEEWDNFEVKDKEGFRIEYAKRVNVTPSPFSAGAGWILDGSEDVVEEEVEGITMTSVLFCKHGGLIMPVTSGQDNVNTPIVGVSDDLIELLKKYETGLDMKGKPLPEGDPALYPYHGESDPPNVLTIAWGHAMKGLDDGWFVFSDGTNINLYEMCIYDEFGKRPVNAITSNQAVEILRSDIEKREVELNKVFVDKEITTMINQQFYDAIFLLTYQMGTDDLINQSDLSKFLEKSNFDLTNEQEIKEQFGEYTNHLEQGTMRRRADELDIIFYGTYDREYDENRYGDIWRKKTYPNVTTPGY